MFPKLYSFLDEFQINRNSSQKSKDNNSLKIKFAHTTFET